MSYNNNARQLVGHHAEDFACEYLQQQGLVLLDRHFSCRMGEIDLIMREKQTVVFVEVRSRTNLDGYDPIESVTFHKQQRLLRTGSLYLQKKGWHDKFYCRFDVVGITYLNGVPQLRWIKHAFTL